MLQRLGLLLARLLGDDLLLSAQAPERARLTAVGFVAHARPASLRRALESFARNLRDHGVHARLVVADDAATRADADAHRRALREVSAAYGHAAEYVGRAEREALAESIATSSGAPLEIVRFALFGDPAYGCSVGANRNALLLSCAGEAFLGCDDDVVARLTGPPADEAQPAAAPSAPPALSLRPEDPCTYRFFASRAAALEGNPERSVDVVAAHEAWLGQRVPLASLGARGVPPGLVARVAASFFGIYGDSGFSSSAGLLYGTTDEARAHLTVDEERYARAMRGRELTRVVVRPTLARPMPFFAGAMALDARALLPPFMPVLRNEDGVFGRLLGLTFRDAFCVHLPLAILHAPEERGPYALGCVEAARRTRFCDLVTGAMVAHPIEARFRDGPERLAAVGRRLRALGVMPPADFDAVSRTFLLRMAAARAERLEALLAASDGRAPYWARDVDEHLRALRAAIDSGELFAPHDLGSAEGTPDAAQLLLGRYGEVIEAWPRIFEAAKAIRDGSSPAAEPRAR